MLQTLEARLALACAGELGQIDFAVVGYGEIARRQSPAIGRRIRGPSLDNGSPSKR
jgi:hypothetical protein